MTEQEMKALHEAMTAGAKIAIAQALERHRRLGESIAVWQDGKVVILTTDQMPPLQPDVESAQN